MNTNIHPYTGLDSIRFCINGIKMCNTDGNVSLGLNGAGKVGNALPCYMISSVGGRNQVISEGRGGDFYAPWQIK